MKYIIVFVSILLTSYYSNSQESLCTNFENYTTGNLLGQTGLNAQIGNLFNNWFHRCSQAAIRNDQNSIPGGSNYLFLQDIGCSNGSSIVWNNQDYSGNWLELGSCFCYDFNIIKNGNTNPPPPNILGIYSGADPFNPNLAAVFNLFNPIQAGSGWHQICPPIALSSGGTLPSNAQGFWGMRNSGTSQDWDQLIQNVDGIYFNIDIGGSPTEQYGIDNICYQSCPGDKVDCCQTDLALWVEPPSEITLKEEKIINGIPLSIATEIVGIHQDASIPITELRVNITDVEFEYDYNGCGNCIENPALWASLYTEDISIGSQQNNLQLKTQPYPVNNLNNMINQNSNVRELLWTNQNGVMLTNGTQFEISYVLPPISEIPCCVNKIRICTKISWKDANCNVCERFNCTTVTMKKPN